MIERIQEAKKSIEVAIYWFGSDKIANELIKAHSSGVTVRMITDNEAKDEEFDKQVFCNQKGIETRVNPIDKEKSLMHNKYMIVDSRLVITGSLNYTGKACITNFENAVVIACPHTVSCFKKNFEYLWNKFEDFNAVKGTFKPLSNSLTTFKGAKCWLCESTAHSKPECTKYFCKYC